MPRHTTQSGSTLAQQMVLKGVGIAPIHFDDFPRQMAFHDNVESAKGI
jgi:hypothetical protein